MKSTYLLAGTNLVLLIGITVPVRATALYSANSEAILTFLNAPDNTVISIDPAAPGNQIIRIEDNFGTDGNANAIVNLNVNDLSSIQVGESLEIMSMVNGSAPPFSRSTAQSTIGVFFTNNSTEEVIFDFSFAYNLAADINVEDTLLDSAFANADFNANFGYGQISDGSVPPPVPIEDIFERVISNEQPMVVDRRISFPVPAQTLGAVSFTATTNGFSNTVSETVPDPSSVFSLLTLGILGITSAVKGKSNSSKSMQ